MKKRLTILFILVCGLVSSYAQEQDNKPLTPLFTAIEFEAGGAQVIDTYLSRWVYSGWDIALGSELMKAIALDNYNWVWQQQIRLSYGRGHINFTGGGLTDHGTISYTFAMMRRSNTPLKGLYLYYGGDAAITGAAIYNYHGGNNPVSVKADISLGLTAMAVYNFKWGELPFTARYQAVLPFIGVFAQPQYSESYYEVGLGNYHNFIHLGTWSNKFDMTNRITIDLHLNSWALRIGYNNHIYTTYAANNRYQLVSHNFVLGFTGDIMRWSKNNEGRPIKKALYAY